MRSWIELDGLSASHSHDAVTVIVSALASGATTRAQVRDAMAGADLEGLVSRIRFDVNGDRIDAPVSLWRVERGGKVPIAQNALR